MSNDLTPGQAERPRLGMKLRLYHAFICFCLILPEALTGCTGNPPQVAPPQPPTVPVSRPVQRQVLDYVDFTWRTDAVNTVNIVPRVTGYLDRMPFQEGSLVKK